MLTFIGGNGGGGSIFCRLPLQPMINASLPNPPSHNDPLVSHYILSWPDLRLSWMKTDTYHLPVCNKAVSKRFSYSIVCQEGAFLVLIRQVHFQFIF